MNKVIKEKRIDSIRKITLANVEWQIGKWVVIYFEDEIIKINTFNSNKKIYSYLLTTLNI